MINTEVRVADVYGHKSNGDNRTAMLIIVLMIIALYVSNTDICETDGCCFDLANDTID